MKAIALSVALAAAGALAHAQPGPADHEVHHPAQGAPAMPDQAQPPPAGTQDAFEHQLLQMQEMHERMMSARTPRERAALMEEQMKLMQSGMDMMQHMGGGMGTGMMQGQGGMGTPGMPMQGQAGMPTPGQGSMGMPGGAAGPGAAQAGQPSGAAAGMGGMAGMGPMIGMMNMHAQMERRMAMMQMMMQMMVDRGAAMNRR